MPFEQCIRERRVAEHRSVVVPPITSPPALAYSFADRGVAAAVITHQIECDPQFNKGKSGLGLAARVVQLPESRQRRLSLPSQNIGAKRQDVEATVVAISENLAAANGGGSDCCRQSRNSFLQTAKQEVHRLTIHRVRHRKTLFTRIKEEIRNVC